MKKLIPVLVALLSCTALFAQDAELRREIDIDRRNIPFASQQAFEKSREYIRKDSTYYIGYMYMGAYMFNRANDEKGFRLAITWLQKAFDLIERDYDQELRTRTNDLVTYFGVSVVQNDYSFIGNWLETAYQNVEEAQKAYEVLTHLKERDLQLELGVETWNTLAWLYHRNRMYTSEKFPFLKNSVQENDSMAYACLDSAIAKTHRDNEINQGLVDPQMMAARYYYTYHYKVILFTYDFELDSADYYYDILLTSGYYSSNNYANYQYMKGEFGIAEQFYMEAEDRDNTSEKHTREYFYMRGLLEVYRAAPERADSLLDRVIRKDGFTPGYGWHSIAYARALMYEGLTTISQRKLNNAARFEELHIGTTWGREQYNLAVATLNYINALRFEGEYYFENKDWYFWLNPKNWYQAIEYKIKVHHFRLIMVSLVAANPERAEVIYPLFSSENLLGWDETWQMLDGFSNKYFIEVYEKMLEEDPRPGVRNYIRFVLARLHISEGDEDLARPYLEEIYMETGGPERMQFDNLLYARTCEAFAQITSGEESQGWLLKSYDLYPQLTPFSGEQLQFRVNVNGEAYRPGVENSIFKIAVFGAIAVLLLGVLYFFARRYFRFLHKPYLVYVSLVGVLIIFGGMITYSVVAQKKLSVQEQIMSGFNGCNIGYTDAEDAPVANFEFVESDSMMNVEYTVYNSQKQLVNSGSITVDSEKPSQAGIVLAYRLFKIDFTYSNAADVDAEEVDGDHLSTADAL